MLYQNLITKVGDEKDVRYWFLNKTVLSSHSKIKQACMAIAATISK